MKFTLIKRLVYALMTNKYPIKLELFWGWHGFRYK